MFKLFLLFALAFAQTSSKNNVYCKTFKNEKCEECLDKTNYILANDECFYKTEKNCQTVFEDGKKCKWCLDTYKMNEDGTCVSGEETCTTEYVEKSGDATKVECKKPECAEGEMKIEGSCVKCAGIQYCAEYTKDTNGCKCKKCEGGANLKSDGKTCEVYDNFCAENVDGKTSECKKCKSGYYLKGVKCEKGSKVEDCMTYESETKCSTCLNGKAPVNGNCVCKVGGCDKCVSGNVDKCETCDNEHYLSGTACMQCASPCASCNGEGNKKCLSCKAKHYLSGTECKSCDASCATCNGEGNKKCLTCAEGYIELDSDEEEGDSSDGQEEGTKRAGEQFKSCYKKIEGCAEYKVEKGVAKCIKCNTNGFVDDETVDGQFTCSECHSSCATCEGTLETNCKTCKEANTVLVGGQCKQCHNSCAKCSEAGKDNKCTECATGKTFVEGGEAGKCYDKIPGCKSHKLEGQNVKCTECEAGHYANKNGGCTKTPVFDDPECYQYKVDGTCGTCRKSGNEGFTYDLEEGECVTEYKLHCSEETVKDDQCLLCLEIEKNNRCTGGLCYKYSWPEGGKCVGPSGGDDDGNDNGNGSFGVFVAFFVAVIMVLF